MARFKLQTYRTVRKDGAWVFKPVVRPLAASDRDQANHLADLELLDVLKRARRLSGKALSFPVEASVAYGIKVL